MQIAHTNQEVPAAANRNSCRQTQADVSDSGTSRSSLLNSIHQIIASSFISAVALPDLSLHVFFLRPNTAFGPVFISS
jgi:hypothetical protein